MAPLQKRAWWGLVTGIVFGSAYFLVFFLMGGIDRFETDANFRLIIDAIMIAALVTSLVIVNLPIKRPGMTDERDMQIIERAPRVQWLAVIFTLVAWTIALTEYYHVTRAIPSVFLFVITMSVLIISALAQSLGILIGYWKNT